MICAPSFRPMAERQVKTRLALEKIAEIENIKAEEADINAEYEKMAAQYSMELDKVKGIPFTRRADYRYSSPVKTVDFVKSKAVNYRKKKLKRLKRNKAET